MNTHSLPNTNAPREEAMDRPPAGPELPVPRLMNTEAAAGFLGLERRTLEDWRYRGIGPAFIHLGRAVRYDIRDLEVFIESQKRHV